MKPWRRSDYIFAAVVLAVVLGASTLGIIADKRHRKDVAMAEAMVRNPPWLMWGGKQSLKLQLQVGNATVIGQQLVKIAYARPESWRFLFTAQVLGVPYPIGPAIHTPTVQLSIDFNVQTGIGRDQGNLVFIPASLPGTEQPGFVHFVIAGAPVLPNERKWTTQGIGPGRDDTLTTNLPNTTDVLVGQDIQVNVRVLASSSSSFADPLILEVGAFFAPNVHIRPEWFKGRMANVEDEGR